MSPRCVGREESGSHFGGQAPPLQRRLFGLRICPLFSLFDRIGFVGLYVSHREEGRGAEGEKDSQVVAPLTVLVLTVHLRQRETGRIGLVPGTGLPFEGASSGYYYIY